MQGKSSSDSNEARRTPQEARIREEIRLTPMKLNRPESSWLNTNTVVISNKAKKTVLDKFLNCK